uniref:Uncharacterized protein n=1 Tax=Ralstonia solanacearum TaxID=305 RepID=A0A0S4WN50_RALSL|nr:protein of unknown function [Ralstonia solanacearum]
MSLFFFFFFFFFLMIRRPPRSTPKPSSAASDVYKRQATNGDLRLEPTPGQWSPIPKVGKQVVDKATQTISVRMVSVSYTHLTLPTKA